MSPITKDQQAYCKLAQLSHALDPDSTIYPSVIENILLQIDDLNFQIPSYKSNQHVLIGSTPLHIISYYEHQKTSYFRCQEIAPHIINNSYRGHVKAFDSLLQRGAEFTIKDRNGHTALHRTFYDMFSEKWNTEDLKTKSGILKNEFVSSVLKAHLELDNSQNPCSADGLSHFHIACAANDIEAMQLLLNSGVSIDESVSSSSLIFPGYTSLHFVARFCGFAAAQLLLKYGADINVTNTEGFTPLQLVIDRNFKLFEWKRNQYEHHSVDDLKKFIDQNEKMINLFLENNNMLDVDSKGFCNFYAACTLTDTSLVKNFIQDFDVNSAISVDSPVWPGYNALHFAVHCNLQTVKILLKNGANIESKDAKGESPFDYFTENYFMEDLHDILTVVPVLENILFSDTKTKFLDFVHALESIRKLEEFLQATPKDIHLPKDCPLWPGYHLSHLIVHFSSSDWFDNRRGGTSCYIIIKLYLRLGGNATFQDLHGRTAVHLAFYEKKYRICYEFFDHKLVSTNVIDNKGLSYLYIACALERESIVEKLLSKSTDVNVSYKGETLNLNFMKLKRGTTPLHVSVNKTNRKLVVMLLQHEAEVNAPDSDGLTPIHYSIRFLHQSLGKKIINLLFSSCKQIENAISHKTGFTHLHVACYIGNKRVVQSLLNMGVNVNATLLTETELEKHDLPTYLSLRTPLNLAIEQKADCDFEIVELLVQAGANILSEKSSDIKSYCQSMAYDKGWSYFNSSYRNGMSAWASALANSVSSQKQLRDSYGITLLHVACFLCQVDFIKKILLDSQSDLNARVYSNSPIWPGSTPLNVLIASRVYVPNLEEAVELLLDYEANVMLENNDGDTPIHLVESMWSQCSKVLSAHNTLRLLLKHHKDYNVNPVNNEGISHFNVACMAGEYSVAEKFLQAGVNVNQAIYYRDKTVIFQTPLHLLLRSGWDRECDINSRIKTVDVLLKYGADVNAQDEKGSSPILTAAQWGPSRQIFFQKLIEAGVDVNWINLKGESALEILVKSKNLAKEEFLLCLHHCNNLNTSNLVDGRGTLALLIGSVRKYSYRKSIFEKILQSPELFSVDETKRTPIHNIVANDETNTTPDEYNIYIERFIGMGYDIDAQDSKGKTALHTAVYFYNKYAVLGLIAAGADVNVTDMNNQTAFSEIVEFQNRFWINKFKCNTKCETAHKGIKRIFAAHLRKLQELNLKVNFENERSMSREYSEYEILNDIIAIRRELRNASRIKIETETLILTLSDFLSETGVIASRPTMASQADRDAVDNFLVNTDLTPFPQLASFLKMQHRKMFKRLRLMDPAMQSLKDLMGIINGFYMPDICCRMIFQFLTNTEIQNLITSVAE